MQANPRSLWEGGEIPFEGLAVELGAPIVIGVPSKEFVAKALALRELVTSNNLSAVEADFEGSNWWSGKGECLNPQSVKIRVTATEASFHAQSGIGSHFGRLESDSWPMKHIEVLSIMQQSHEENLHALAA